MDDLEDIEYGTWEVTTETSQYLIDLSGRRLKRLPGQGLGPSSPTDRVLLLLAELEGDYQWTPLLELLRCRVGEPLVALTDPQDDGSVVYRQSTNVRRIRRLHSNDDNAAADAPQFYNRDGKPISNETALRYFSDDDYRILRRDTVGDLEVVTAWLGADQDPASPGPPLIFGTVAITPDGAFLDDREDWAATENEALANHEHLVTRLRDPTHSATPHQETKNEPTAEPE